MDKSNSIRRVPHLELPGSLPVVPFQHGSDEPVFVCPVFQRHRLRARLSRAGLERQGVDGVGGLRHARSCEREGERRVPLQTGDVDDGEGAEE